MIDTKDRFLLEIDGTDIPHVSTYNISKSVSGFLTMQVVLSVNEVEELDIETDKPAAVSTAEETPAVRARRRRMKAALQ